MPVPPPPLTANHLLAALPRESYKRLQPLLQTVALHYGEVLHEPAELMRHAYFPLDCLVSLLTTVEPHKALEVGMIGHEGMVGISLGLGSRIAPMRALVQGSGWAARISATRFIAELRSSPPLHLGLLRHTHTLLAQVSLTAACNRFHKVDARLARWLLMTADRLQSEQFRLTHAFLAQMLGVRRVGVTEAAGAMEKRKIIDYSRGRIHILDRQGLESAACSCYRFTGVFT